MRLPLFKNYELVNNLKNLISWYDKCEVLLGDDLKKDQLMFMHALVSHIFLSPLKDTLGVEDDDGDLEAAKKKEDGAKKKDDLRPNNTLAMVIPSIAAFQGLRHMAEARALQEARKKELEELGETMESIKLPSKHVLFSNDTEDRYEGLPRIWMWEGFIQDNRREQWLQMSDEVGALNIMIQEDIVDYFITSEVRTRGAPPKQPEELRPPKIWNYHVYENEYVLPREELILPSQIQPKKTTQAEEERIEIKPLHVYRPRANPIESYVDGRVQKLIKTVEKMGGGLKIKERDRWDLLVREVIRTMKKDPPPLEEAEISEDEVLMHRPQELEPQEESKEIES